MPIDASIPQSIQPLNLVNPLELYSRALQVRQQGEQLREQREQSLALAKQRRSMSVFESALQDPNNLKPDGSLDDEKVATSLRRQDIGAWQQWSTISAANQKNAIDTTKALTELQNAQLDNASKQRTAAELKQGYLGKLAFHGEQLLTEQPTDALHARDTVLATVARAAADGMIAPDQAKAFLVQTAHASPDQLRQVLGTFVSPDLRMAMEKDVAANQKTKAEADKLAAEAAGLTANGGRTPAQIETERHNRATEAAARVRAAAAAGADASDRDVEDAVLGMMDGINPPLLPGRASKEYITTLAVAKRHGFDLAGAATDWMATQKHIATMNGAQQLRLNQSINALPEMLDSVEALSSQWNGGRFPILNRANLTAAKNGVYGQEVASVATRLEAQIADVTADLGNVYMGGNSPTDHALGLAGKSLGGDWSEKVLKDAIVLARNNVKIRSNSIRNTGVAGASADNPYAPPPAPAVAPAGDEWVRDPVTNKLIKKGAS